MRLKAAFVFALLVVGIGAATAQEIDETLFPRPASLEPAIEFWKRVYTEIDTNAGFIHDSARLDVVYETVDLGNTRSSRQRRRQIDEARDHYREILTRLASGEREDLSAEERRVLALWPDGVDNDELEAASHRLRFQLGQADRFLAGLERSGAYRAEIERVLREKGLPEELVALPHVESSFDPTAYSRVGAAGMWQFTRSTGLRYMRIDHIVDERRDPFMSTRAAAQLLKDNYAVLESWPLALTAYNHGQAGMRRAAREEGTKDIGVIIANYDGRYFGFASRNFYPAFVAALEIDQHPERFFDSVRLEAPDRTVTAEVPDYVEAKTLAKTLGVRLDRLRGLNPALMDTVWAGDKFVPKGFALRLPASLTDDPATLLASLPASERYAAQRPDLYHRVRRGDTLSEIAEQYGLGLSELLRANNLKSRDFIRVGQVLTLPVKGQPRPQTLAAQTTDADGRYIVRRGDTIEVIATRLGIDPSTLVAENDIADENRIFAGQVLRVAMLDHSAADNARAQVRAATAPKPAAPPVSASRTALASSAPVPAESGASVASGSARALDAPAGADRGNFDPALVTERLAAAEPPPPARDASAVATLQARLAADPSDYSVDANGTIEVHSLETLGHYADWLEIRTQRLRDINGFRFGRAVVIGERIELDFSNVDPKLFEQRRLAYQESIQESFFSRYRIADVTEHVIHAGESLWLLAQRTYNVPVWLLRQYNPDLDLDRVKPGTVVKFPKLTRIADDERTPASTEGELG